MRFLVFVLFVLGITQPVFASDFLNPQKWRSLHFQDHPLVGKMFSVEGKQVAIAELQTAMKSSTYLLLGEIHNNPDHHLLQAQFVSAFARIKNTKPAVVFEMVPERLQGVLNGATQADLKNLAEKLEWKKRGWYSWVMYQPIFEAAFANKLPLKAGNIGRKQTRALSKKGITSLSKSRQKQLSLDATLTAPMKLSLNTELRDSHCGLLPASAFGAMSLVQRARDGAMAKALHGHSSDGSILIAGNGHVRKDRGVPRLLKGQKMLVIGLLEVDGTHNLIKDYQLTNVDGAPLYDYVYFTPKYDIKDHCAALRKRFKKKKPASE